VDFTTVPLEDLQSGCPDGVISSGTWTPVPGGTLSSTIDEEFANDADYNQSANNPSNDEFEVSLENVVDPQIHTGHVVNYRYGKSSSAGKQIDITVSLRQGTSTQIASQTHVDVGAGFTAGSLTLSTIEASNITDYSDLRIRVVANSVGGGAGRSGQISWVCLEVPSAAEEHNRSVDEELSLLELIETQQEHNRLISEDLAFLQSIMTQQSSEVFFKTAVASSGIRRRRLRGLDF